MKEYSNIISLVKNGRGVYCLDPVMGCASGMTANEGGCYNDCYAAKAAARYGYDFSKSVLRHFESLKHKRDITYQISKIKMPFVRMGCSGDPSENWEHTLSICRAIKSCNKEIIIITRHWNLLTDEQLQELSRMNICINTSISALDDYIMLSTSLDQYNRIKPYCKSVLRIISCNFNTSNPTGLQLSIIQDNLFKNESTLDTVFRPSKNNHFIADGIINVKGEIFNGKPQLASKMNRKTYMGKCGSCQEMCGVNIQSDHSYPNKPGIIKQLNIFQ